MKLFAKIRKISYYLPGPPLSIDSNSNNRYHASQDEIGSDLAYKAVLKLFNDYPEIDKREIDFLIVSTLVLDYNSPTTASVLHHKLGLSSTCGTIDLPQGCSGFLYSLSVAEAMISAGNARNVLILLGEVPTKAIHSEDIVLRSIFGDAGAAIVVSENNTKAIGKFTFATFGNGFDFLKVERGGGRNPIDEAWINKYSDQVNQLPFGRIEMNGLEVLRFALKEIPGFLEQTLVKNGLTISEIDFFIFHQASAFILKSLQRKCNIPEHKFISNFEEVGNTVSCSIPIALETAAALGTFKKGDKIVLLGFGIGFSCIGTVIEW
ncbi:MAG: ketoacyl-ACP synthase III [Flavobacteriia bacterium]|nr:ketoacyl-ACP synthase III [Flavobacteriia bacterium]